MTKSKHIKICYFASLREQAGISEEEVETESSKAVGLYEELLSKYHFTLPKENVGVAINGQLRSIDWALSSGDTVVYIPPVAGG